MTQLMHKGLNGGNWITLVFAIDNNPTGADVDFHGHNPFQTTRHPFDRKSAGRTPESEHLKHDAPIHEEDRSAMFT